MNEKEKYIEIAHELIMKIQELNERDYEDNVQISVFNALSSLIKNFNDSIDKLQGERKKNAENAFKSLLYVYNRIGMCYLKELKWRKQLFQANKLNLELVEKVDKLEKEIEKLNKIDEL